MYSTNYKMSPIIPIFVFFLLLKLSICAVKSNDTQNFRHGDEAKDLDFIRAQLKKINKPAVKTIHSPNGDIIDCVLSHKQPAFDHPLLKGQKPLDPPDDLPTGYESTSEFVEENIVEENIQIWRMSNETCPEGTIAIRRTTEQDLLRGPSSIKSVTGILNRSASGFEHAIGFVNGDIYYGAKATMSVWTPKVANKIEFSGSQLRIRAGNVDINSISAGWQVYEDNTTRLFTHWAVHNESGHVSRGCYNLQCQGFVSTNKEIVPGSTAFKSISSYNGSQFITTLLIWKDRKTGNWWLRVGNYGRNFIGYWPSTLFTHLNDHADHVEFGGEVWSIPNGSHTTTQMGSGHFAEEGFRQAAYFRDMKVVVSNNKFKNVDCLRYFMTYPNCYDIQPNTGNTSGTYFFYGGPGKNPRCP